MLHFVPNWTMMLNTVLSPKRIKKKKKKRAAKKNQKFRYDLIEHYYSIIYTAVSESVFCRIRKKWYLLLPSFHPVSNSGCKFHRLSQ